MAAAEDNGNGKVSIAVLKTQMDTLLDEFREVRKIGETQAVHTEQIKTLRDDNLKTHTFACEINTRVWGLIVTLAVFLLGIAAKGIFGGR
jgi:hypothetical protein